MSTSKKIDTIFQTITNLFGKNGETAFKFEQLLEPSPYTGIEIATEKKIATTPVFAYRTKDTTQYFTMFAWAKPGAQYDEKLREIFEIKCSEEGIYYVTPAIKQYTPLNQNSLIQSEYWEIKTIFYVVRDIVLS